MKYYKAKELIKTIETSKDCSYEINKHVIYTAYYALKHNIPEEEFGTYLNSVIEKTHKKLYCCGCQCDITSPLGKRISAYEGGGDCIKYAECEFKDCVRLYYNDLCIYNSTEDDGVNDGKAE